LAGLKWYRSYKLVIELHYQQYLQSKQPTKRILLITVLLKLHRVPHSATEFKEENFIKKYHPMPSIIHKIIEEF